ncbi:hypothetical protein tb265_04840 [Gemmatimonadetes bacterium T265]|nr:hypothetical protein tb265_04840 [Gemmatimonadetes bacterium T265]
MSRRPTALARSAVLAFGAVLAACAEPPAAPAPARARAASTAPSRAADVTRGPAGFFVVADFATGLVATFGLEATPAAFCAGGVPFPFSPGREQDVRTPAGALHIQAQVRGARVVVYAGIPADFCALGTAAAPVLGTGTGDFSSLENNAGQGGPGADHYRAAGRGAITLAGGGTARVQASATYHLLPDGTVVADEGSVTLSAR